MTKLEWRDCSILIQGKYFFKNSHLKKTVLKDSNSHKEVIKSHGHLVAVTRAASPPPAVRRHDRAVAEEDLFNIDDDRGGGDDDEEDDSGGGDTLMNEFQLATLTEN